jgi:hypothetical protein
MTPIGLGSQSEYGCGPTRPKCVPQAAASEELTIEVVDENGLGYVASALENDYVDNERLESSEFSRYRIDRTHR